MGALGVLLGALEVLLWCSWGALGVLLGALGCSWAALGVLLACSWGALGCSWGALGLLGCSWAVMIRGIELGVDGLERLPRTTPTKV